MLNFADMGLESFVRGNVLWEGDYIRLVLMKKDSKGVSIELVKQVSANLRKIGCRCVIEGKLVSIESCLYLYIVLIDLKL